MLRWPKLIFALVLLTLLARGVAAAPPEAKPENTTKSWNAELTAQYLDEHAAAWQAWPKAQQADGTSCVSCHTVFPYLAARGALGRKLAARTIAPLDKQLAQITQRVEHWNDAAPWYGFSEEKTVESRAAESVLNALALSIRDAESSDSRLSDATSAAFAAMWSTQLREGPNKGSWPWLDFKLGPWETAGANFWGATLAALAVSFAPEHYADRPEIAPQLALLREYLVEHVTSDKPNLHHRTMLLLASVRGKGLLDRAGQESVAKELLSVQLPDGSWSMDALGDWKIKDAAGDAYATGLACFTLWHLEGPYRAAAKRGCQWLVDKQDPTTGAWPSKSVNKSRDPASFAGQFMQHAAAGFATLALLVNE
jgi:hypothetical protein